MGGFVPVWGAFWAPLGGVWGGFGGLEQMNLIITTKTKGAGDQKANPRAAKEAPRRPQVNARASEERPSRARARKRCPGGVFLPSDLFSKKKISKSI